MVGSGYLVVPSKVKNSEMYSELNTPINGYNNVEEYCGDTNNVLSRLLSILERKGRNLRSSMKTNIWPYLSIGTISNLKNLYLNSGASISLIIELSL